MNYLLVESLSKSYQDKLLFEDISFGINRGQKVALVAKNGAGKSTLLRILIGTEIADSGAFNIRKEITTAFLEQEPHLDEEKSIIENVFTGNSPIIAAIKEYEAALEAQEENYTPANAQRLEDAHEQMSILEAWDYEQKIKHILSQLNIHHLEQPVKTLSGGQKKRVALSKVLILEPEFLIMDEPTNHLDVEMIEWLEEHLASKNMTLLIVTHDRYFLDRICNHILELEDGKLFHHRGNFSYFIEKKAEREMMQASELDKVRNTYRKELEWVRKMPKARTVKNKARVDNFDVIEEKAKGKKKEDALVLDVKMTRMGGKILDMVNLSKAYGSIPIVNNFTYTFKKHEKIGIVGKNGVGKTTFLNMIMEKEKHDSGKLQSGETIIFGYYTQDGMVLKEDKRVIEVVRDIADFIPLADGSKLSASQLLLRFQFTPEVQYSYVSKLSGGEKRRLYLMTILITNPNFLILDEPTNDLDIVTLSILEDFLVEFQGCLLIVSHDRYFMDKLVEHLFVFEGKGEIKVFPGNYSDYRIWKEQQEREERRAFNLSSSKVVIAPIQKHAETITQTPKRKLSFKEKHNYEQLEKELEKLEIDKKNLENQLSDGSLSHDKILSISVSLQSILKTIDTKTMQWLELSELM